MGPRYLSFVQIQLALVCPTPFTKDLSIENIRYPKSSKVFYSMIFKNKIFIILTVCPYLEA